MESYVRRLADTELANAPLIFVTGLPKHVTIQWVRRFFEARGYQTSYVLRDGFWLLALRRTPAGGEGPS